MARFLNWPAAIMASLTARMWVALGALAASITSMACDEDPPGPRLITEIGIPSPDVPAAPAPTDLELPSCAAEPGRTGVGSWRAISNTGAPAYAHYGAWTGKELVIVNPLITPGQSVTAYDPASDTWRAFTIPSYPEDFDRWYPFIGAVGNKLIIYGGHRTDQGHLRNGWLLDLETGVWTAMNADGAPPMEAGGGEDDVPRMFAAGTRALFVGGPASGDKAAVASYDTVSGRWEHALAPADATTFSCRAPGWNGTQVMCAGSSYLFEISADPLAIKTVPRLFDPPNLAITFVPVGDRFFGWGEDAGGDLSQAFFFDPARDLWSVLAASPARRFPQVSGAQGRVIIWGGSHYTNQGNGPVSDRRTSGVVFDPATNTWSPTSCIGAPAIEGNVFRTSTGFIQFDGNQAANVLFELGAGGAG